MRPVIALATMFSVASGLVGQARAAYTFTTINVPGALSTQATAINDLGRIVGDYGASTGPFTIAGNAFVDTAGTFSTINVPFMQNQYNPDVTATGINNAGQIVGSYAAQYVTLGYQDNGGSFTPINYVNFPPSTDDSHVSGRHQRRRKCCRHRGGRTPQCQAFDQL